MNSRLLSAVLIFSLVRGVRADELPVVKVEGQPLGANILRIVKALELVGQPLSREITSPLEAAARERDFARLQSILDKHVLLAVAINPESRVKVQRGPAPAPAVPLH